VITVSAAVPGDALAVAGLQGEMDRFYGADGTEPIGDRVRQINEAVFYSPPAAWVLLARDGDALAGIAAYSFLWPAVGLARSLYLKELYVGALYRRQGVAKLLMQTLFDVAGRHGCSRVESALSSIPRSSWWRGTGCGAIRVPGPEGWTAVRLSPSRCGRAPMRCSARCDPVSGIVVSVRCRCGSG
jgi:GNAT superfamily N-acetyltransferase